MLVPHQRNHQMKGRRTWNTIFHPVNELTQAMVISRESQCLPNIIVEEITEDFVDVGEEGAQEEIIVDGDGSKHASQILQALY